MSVGIWIIYAGIASDILPVATSLPRWAALSRAMRFMALCVALMMAADLTLVALASQHRNNHWLIHVGTPFYVVLTLLGLAEWQLSRTAARTMRGLAVAFVIVWLVCMLRVEDLRRFSNIGRPLCSLLICAAAGFTLLRKAQVADRPLTDEGWFWICAGWLLLYATSVLLNPVSNILSDAHSPLAYVVHPIHSLFNLVANLLLAVGFLRERDPQRPATLVLT